MLINKQINAVIEPLVNTDSVISPMLVGTKKPITVDATSILEMSARYFERMSI